MHNPTQQKADAPWWTEEQASTYLQVSERWLQRARQTGNGPRFSKVGHFVRYTKAWLDEFAESQARTSTSTAA
jgi:hypothetical protein